MDDPANFFVVILCPIILFFIGKSVFKDWKRDRDWISYFNKKAFIISMFVFLIFFIGMLFNEADSGYWSIITIVFLTIGSFLFSLLFYIFLWWFFDDPRWPKGHVAFENHVQLVLTTRQNGYKIPFPLTIEMYKTAELEMERYMTKHGIIKVSLGESTGLEVYMQFESQEARDEYFKNVPGYQKEKQKIN
jgi:ACR3 family arsenite efflux pump ArsB